MEFKNILIGHADNEATGVTVILAPQGVTAGACVRGAAPGTRETDLLRPEKTVDKINAVVLSGGSAFGLDSCSGVMRRLHEKNCGFDTGIARVPIVSGAVLFDLVSGALNFPDAAMGYRACVNAKELSFKNGLPQGIKTGAAGAGKGARCGRVLGAGASSPAGIGFACIEAGGTAVAAVIAVNALGDVYDNATGKILAGARAENGGFLDSAAFVLSGGLMKLKEQLKGGTNTVIGAVITNAKLSKLECNKLAEYAHEGITLSVRPAHTELDGDTIFAMSAGEQAAEFNTLCAMAAEAVRQAVLNSVKK